MKKLNFFILFWLMALTTSWTQGDGAFSVHRYYQDLPQEVATELDCIGRKYLDHDGIDRKLRKAFQGYSGYYLQYDQVHRDIPLYGTQHTVILKDDLFLNTIIPAENRFDIPRNYNVEVSKTKTQAEVVIKSGISSDKVPLFQGLFWVKQENLWVPAYLFMVFNDITAGFDPMWVEASDGGGGRFRNSELNKAKTMGTLQNLKQRPKIVQDHEFPTFSIQNNSCTSPGMVTAKLYWTYPENSFGDQSAPFATSDGKKILGCNSTLKYNPIGENDLEASSQNNFDFIYNSTDVEEKKKYAKTYAFLKTKSLFPDLAVNMSTWDAGNYVGYNGGLLKYGIGFNKPAAMDEFWIAFAGIDKEKKDAGAISATPSALYNAYIDYLAQDMLGKIGTDPLCNHYGLTGPGGIELKTNVSAMAHCFGGNTAESTNTRNAFSTLLAEIHQDPTLGADLVEGIMGDLLASQPAKFSESPYNLINAMWTQARSLQANNTITMAQLCALRSKFNTYFSICDPNDWSPINDHIADLMIRDTEEDEGSEPHAFEQLYVSPDIWNTNSQGIGSLYEPVIGVQNTMHVRVKNVGCDTETGKKLKVYWNFASMGLAWPNGWTKLDTDPIISLTSGTSDEYTINWTPVDPATQGLESHKVCILARITNDNDVVETSYGWFYDETTSVGDNVKKNNGISLRNMTLIPKGPGIVGDPNDDDIVTVYIEDPEPPTVWPPDPVNPDTRLVDITCVVNLPPNSTGDPLKGVIDLANPVNYDPKAPVGPGSSQATGTGPSQYPDSNTAIDCERGQPAAHVSDPEFFDKGEVWINIKRADAQNWGGLTLQGTGFTTGRDGWIKMTGLNFNLTSLPLVKGVKYLLGVKYKPKVGFAPSSFSLMERDAITKDVIGGEVYIVTEDDIVVDDINDSSVQSRTSTKLEELVIHPNPTTGIVNIILPNNQNLSKVKIYNLIGQLMYDQDIKQKSSEHQCNVQSWAEGSYIVKIETLGGEMYSQKFVKK